MKFRHEYVMPDYVPASRLQDDAEEINRLITLDDDDAPDMVCMVSAGELVFEGFCEVYELPRIAKLCDELIFQVTDERAE